VTRVWDGFQVSWREEKESKRPIKPPHDNFGSLSSTCSSYTRHSRAEPVQPPRLSHARTHSPPAACAREQHTIPPVRSVPCALCDVQARAAAFVRDIIGVRLGMRDEVA
jgi:hypothetical protein